MADNAAIAREYLECFNKRDFNGMRGYLHPEYTYTGGDGQEQQGPDAGIAVAQMFGNAFSDGQLTIRNAFSVGDTAVVEFTGAGTHDGDLMGIAATGRPFSIPVCIVAEIRDGKIYSEHEYMDMAHLLGQLGVGAPAGAAASA